MMEASSNASSCSPSGTSDSAANNKNQPRPRNLWTKAEDEILMRGAAMLLEQDGITNVWSRIAASLPRRTNKDCRKRWMKICKKVNKGAWTSAEDARLVKAVQQHGQSWIQVAQVVQTRHADQCAKRWQQSLDPSIVPARWQARDDETLLAAVKVHGRKWKTIADEFFPTRSTTDLKNRYSVLTKERSNSMHSKTNSTSNEISIVSIEREMSPESEADSIDSLSDFEGHTAQDIADMMEMSDMPDVDMGMPGFEGQQHNTTPSLDDRTTTSWPFTPSVGDHLDAGLYSSSAAAFDYSLIDNDPNFALTLTPPVDMDGSLADGMAWNAPPPTSNPMDNSDTTAGSHLIVRGPSLPDFDSGDEGTMKKEGDNPEVGILRRPRSKTTLVLEDVDAATLSQVIGILAAAKTKIRMESGD